MALLQRADLLGEIAKVIGGVAHRRNDDALNAAQIAELVAEELAAG